MNYVFITAVRSPTNELRSAGYSYSIDSWKCWCRANEVELRVLEQPLFEGMRPNYFRYWCFDLLDDFDQICLVDADTIIHPKCPNFFEFTKGKFCAVRNDGDYDWVIRSIENYQFEFPSDFARPFNIWKYFNSGFLVFGCEFKDFFEDFKAFVIEQHNIGRLQEVQKKYGTGTDQPLINLFVNERCPWLLELLPYQFNMQDLSRKNILDDRMLFTRIPGIYHFNAIVGGPTESNKWLEKTHHYLQDANHIKI